MVIFRKENARAARGPIQLERGLIVAAAASSLTHSEIIVQDLTIRAEKFTQAALDRTKSIPYRRLARRRAQLLTYAAGALLRFSWTYDQD